MQITQKALGKLRQIWALKNPNKPLSDSELLDLGTRLLNLTEAIYRPISHNQKEEKGRRETGDLP